MNHISAKFYERLRAGSTGAPVGVFENLQIVIEIGLKLKA